MKKLLKNKWLWAAVAVIVVVAYMSGVFSPADVPVEAVAQ
jgi:hypothetical protein